MNKNTVQGILTQEKGRSYILDNNGIVHFQNDLIWYGYSRHWLGKTVCARYLKETDETGDPIVIMWPYSDPYPSPYIQLYYNERLPGYLGSILGHIAVNVNGEIFNFSYKLNENEVLSVEEYFYRPAIGEFAPLLKRGMEFQKTHPHHDNFGRLFMRSIYVLSIEGKELDTKGISAFFHKQLDIIHNTPPDPKRPDIYPGFHLFRRNCATLVRDGLRETGILKIRGIAPRDLFVNASYCLLRNRKKRCYKVNITKMKQLKVPEAPYSVVTPLLNPLNWNRLKFLRRISPSFQW